MPQAAKSLIALVGAIGLVVGAVVVRGALDEKEVKDAIQVRLTCDPALAAACERAAAADARLKVTTEAPARTRARLQALAAGDDPGVDAWATVGPWLAMTDGARSGLPPLGRSTRAVASTRVALVQRPEIGTCKPTPISCGADRVRNVGMQQPPDDGVALAGAAWLVASTAGLPVKDLDLAALTTGAAAGPLRELKARARPAGLSVVNTNFAQAQVVVTTAAAARAVPPPPTALTVPLDVSAVAELSFLRDDAAVPLDADADAGKALRDGLVAEGWLAQAEPSGLPDAGVLAALQEAWRSA